MTVFPPRAHELAGYHYRRAAIYRALDARCPTECFDRSCRARAELFRAAGLETKSELAALSWIEGKIAQALLLGDLSGAAALSAIERRYLEDHAVVCLNRLAAMMSSGGPRLARALDEDLRLDPGAALEGRARGTQIVREKLETSCSR